MEETEEAYKEEHLNQKTTKKHTKQKCFQKLRSMKQIG